MSLEVTALVLAWLAITLLALAMSGILRQVRALSIAVAGTLPRMRGPMPGIYVADVPGLVDDDARASILLFVGGGCSGCDAVLPTFLASADVANHRADHVLVCSGEPLAQPNGKVRVLSRRIDAFEALQVPATPYAVLIDERGVVASASPVGSPQMLREWLDAAVRSESTS